MIHGDKSFIELISLILRCGSLRTLSAMSRSLVQ